MYVCMYVCKIQQFMQPITFEEIVIVMTNREIAIILEVFLTKFFTR